MDKKVLHLMRKGGITCSEDSTLREVAQIMVVNAIRYCIVTNSRHEILGIISARSLLRGFADDPDETRAKDILLPYTITITPDTPLTEAIELMSRKKIEHLIIVSGRPGSKAVLGLLNAEDIVDKMANGWGK